MSTTTAIHQWVHGGAEVLIVRFVTKDGKAYGGFQHPMNIGDAVSAPDWNTAAECGGGIHGWPWGHSLGDGKDCEWGELWQVYGVLPTDIVDLTTGKVKFKTGTLRYAGSWDGALRMVNAGWNAWVHHSASGAASATGWRGAASATGERGAASATGERGAASATGSRGAASATGESGAASATGWRGAASAMGERGAASATGWSGAASATGERGAASATGWSGAASATGWRGAASAMGESGAASATGERGAASATGSRGAASATGWRGAASATGGRGAASATGGRGAASATGESGAASATGESGAAVVTGLEGRARAGEGGVIALAHTDGTMRCARTGKKQKCKPEVWYALDEGGNFVAIND